MFGLGKLLAPLLDLARKVSTPPAIPSNASELAEVEREIDEGAAIVEENVRANIVRRARSMVGKGRYKLGAGGKSPTTPTPFDTDGHCDCSGFVSWCIGRPRHDKVKDEWVFTDSMEQWGKKQGIPWIKALPGDVVVYGAGKAIGHCGIVVETDDAGPVKVVHCNAGKPPAVDETSAELFERKHAVIWRP